MDLTETEMTLEEYESLMKMVIEMRMAAYKVIHAADLLDSMAKTKAGLQWEPGVIGMPCWKIRGRDGYYDTPEEAIEVMNDMKEAPA